MKYISLNQEQIIYNYGEHAIFKWGSNSERSISSSNVTYINADNVQSDLETYLKNIDTKFTTTCTLPILVQDIQTDNTSNKNLFTELPDFFGRIKQNQHNLEMTRVALAGLGIIVTAWQSTY
jgi:hypothetical protein